MGAAGFFALLGAGSSPDALVINSISLDGTNLVLNVSVSAGLGPVGLEMRTALDAPWQEQTLSSVSQSSGPDWILVTPKPEAPMAFFRLKAAPATADPSSIPTPTSIVHSGEMQYAIIRPLAADKDEEAVFHFKGQVDGSDQILITHDGALWSHLHWQWPTPEVTINGTRWNSREKNYLTTRGPEKFLHDAFSLESVHLELIRGRDVVALERVNNGLMVFINDLQPGAAPYEFKVHFHRAQTQAVRSAGTPARLKVAGQIDGSDHVIITAEGATWKHKTWHFPENISLNGVPWPTNDEHYFPNLGDQKFLPAGVDFSTARIVSRKGRDLAAMWAEPETVHVWFADNPNGSDYYELEIAFGE
jgi:hypothetical protein